MRRIAILAGGLAWLALAAPASAAITTTNDPTTLANAIDVGSALSGASFIELPATGTPHGVGDAALGGFPTAAGTFAILTTGDAAVADDAGAGASVALSATPGHGFAGAPGNAYDASMLSVSLDVPAEVNCMSIDFRFLSEDFSSDFYNDGFLALLDDTTFSVDPEGDIAAPNNFAFDEAGTLPSSRANMTEANAVGTAYDGATQLLTARTAVTQGAHTLTLVVFDTGDEIVDAAVFLDNLQFTDVGAGTCGAVVDRVSPALTMDPVADGGTTDDGPILEGDAGAATTDSGFVTVQVYPAGTSQPSDVLSGSRDNEGRWVVQATGLEPGDYFATAHQTDATGNLGVSVTRTFTVGGADTTAPQVRITSPANGSSTTDTTPALSGSAGAAARDLDEVDVTLRAGSSASGTVVQTLTTDRSGGAWSVDADALAPGTYTATASQSDASGNLGVSPPVTFTVTSSPPPPPPPPPPGGDADSGQSPEPVLGETVVAGKVGTGTVRIKLRNGKFRTLGANEAIPLGSEIDATKGRVRLTSAAGPGGAVQTADFFSGAFVITQTGGSKPVTQLKLSGKLACAKAGKNAKPKAKSSAKGKKVRRLWGDGKGRFRTRGRHGAATVRGTKWLTEDRCDSTKVTVKRGTVVVRDFARKKNKVVKKGQSYVARAKRKKK